MRRVFLALAVSLVSAATSMNAEAASVPQLYMAGDSIMTEYANYPKGKRDAAHVRDAGAYFYARGAVEMAREQGLPLADLWKDPSSVPFVPSVPSATSRVGGQGF